MRPWLLALPLAASACFSGFSFGENQPGEDTSTEPPDTWPGAHRVGAIAVEPDEDQLWVVHEENRDGVVRGRLAAIDPVSHEAIDVLDVTGTDNRRVLFPAHDRMLLFAHAGNREHLVLIDTTTHEVIAKKHLRARYDGTSASPSGRLVLVRDGADARSPLHLIDTATLARRIIPSELILIGAAWSHGRDVLTAMTLENEPSGRVVARMLEWNLEGADLAGQVPAPAVVWEHSGALRDALSSVSISADDRWVVWPVRERAAGGAYENRLVVFDRQTATGRLTAGSGPLAVAHDGRIVSFGPAVDGGDDLWLIEPATLARTVVKLPGREVVSFFPMRDSAHILAAAPVYPDHEEALTIYDTDTGAMRQSTAFGITLFDLVARPGRGEVFLESRGDVFELALATGEMTRVDLAEEVSHLNATPTTDRAFAAATWTATIYPIAMATAALDGAPIELRSPFDGEVTGDVLGGTTAPTAPRRFPAGMTRRQHDGDAISLERR
ncbi:MAG: hypothetical protein KF773_06535 [Deltaproteobacteria bacterium]|nr:hypothetical protein [Deltaproteobacteria bacterium]